LFRNLNEISHTLHFIFWFREAEYSRRTRRVRACSTYGKKKGIYRVLVKKPKGKRTLGRPRRRWEDNIKMDLQEARWGMDTIDLAQDRDSWQAVVTAVMNLRVL
jgi:hypothetical protein